MRLIIFFIGCFLFILKASADDVPTIVEGAETYNEAMCIENYTNDCISTICLTSSDRDCQDKCAETARDKCAEQQLE